jgi:hypothetical protein
MRFPDGCFPCPSRGLGLAYVSTPTLVPAGLLYLKQAPGIPWRPLYPLLQSPPRINLIALGEDKGVDILWLKAVMPQYIRIKTDSTGYVECLWKKLLHVLFSITVAALPCGMLQY